MRCTSQATLNSDEYIQSQLNPQKWKDKMSHNKSNRLACMYITYHLVFPKISTIPSASNMQPGSIGMIPMNSTMNPLNPQPRTALFSSPRTNLPVLKAIRVNYWKMTQKHRKTYRTSHKVMRPKAKRSKTFWATPMGNWSVEFVDNKNQNQSQVKQSLSKNLQKQPKSTLRKRI